MGKGKAINEIKIKFKNIKFHENIGFLKKKCY